MLDKHIEQFVRERADGIAHSGRTFFDHLKGTYDLLERHGANVHVCLAGLCHSIYGTNAFKQAAVPLNERAKVAELIGDKAERLAYIFCSCNRPHALVAALKNELCVKNRRDDSWIALSPEDLEDLLLIEMANLIEQDSPGVNSVIEALEAIHA